MIINKSVYNKIIRYIKVIRDTNKMVIYALDILNNKNTLKITGNYK